MKSMKAMKKNMPPVRPPEFLLLALLRGPSCASVTNGNGWWTKKQKQVNHEEHEEHEEKNTAPNQTSCPS